MKPYDYEHEITFYNGNVQYETSTTIYLNETDIKYLEQELLIDLNTIKSIFSYKIGTIVRIKK